MSPYIKYNVAYIWAYAMHKKYYCKRPLNIADDDLWHTYNMGGEL